ncbi:MAG TPA: TetR/AcrR family transcriptional regulator [Jatrophihabitans sp.]|nr:TetR/AcrR family transcriptional regulator [Jatrophihabitans sp.]
MTGKGLMSATPGRREQNKLRTRRAIRQSALELFKRDGFDRVTTSQVAEAAGVSPATVFNYFATKEDLFFGQVAQLERELRELVAAVPAGESILTALRGHVLYELTAGRAQTNPPDVVSFHAVVADSASLRAREAEIYERRAAVLADALAAAGQPSLLAQVAARQYVAAEQLIAAELRRRLAGGGSPRQIIGELDELVVQVFELLRTGLGDLAPAG